jgi:hypothetical protein
MTSFEDREKLHEAKYVHDQDTMFKINARRNKLLGQWVGDLLGKSGDALAAYAKEVVMVDFEEPGEEDVYAKVKADFDGSNVEMSEHRIRRQMADLLDEARNQIQNEV